MDCKQVVEALFLFVDNEMGEDQQTPFRDHVAQCPNCSDQMKYTVKLLLVIRERCSRCPAPDGLRLRILTNMAHRQKPLGPF
jgi:anti-sigma factor (TIGR02949 family)